MRSAVILLLFTLQMQVFGINFKSRLAKKFDSHRSRPSVSREISLVDPEGGRRINHLRKAERLGNVTQENSNQAFGRSLHEGAKISRPSVYLAHRPASTNAKGFWNQFMFRGKSDWYILPVRNIEVRQEKCRALTFSQRIFHENCETLELQNNVCFGKCDSSPSAGEDGGFLQCAVCSPVIIASKTVKLKCADDTEIIKVVKIIEDCECKTKEGKQSYHNGPVLVDPNVPQ